MKHKNKIRRFTSLALAMMMCLGMSANASAAESGITYDVFQIFTGQYADAESGSQGAEDMTGKTLSNVKWGLNGTGTEGEAVDDTVLERLEALTGENGGDQEASNEEFDNKDKLGVILDYVNLDSTPFRSGLTLDEVNGLTLDNGYYLVRTTPGSVGEGEAYSTYTVQVLNNKIVLVPKTGVPTIEKKVDPDKSKNDVAINDVVKFVVSGTLPENMHDYREYYWAITDTMSDGLTWAAERRVDEKSAGVVSVIVKTLNNEFIDVTSEMYIGAKNENGEILMGFDNLFHAMRNGVVLLAGAESYDAVASHLDGATITVTYQAIVNDKAAIATDENTNEVVLEYSNDPNHSGDGTSKNDPEIPPVPENPTGNTVKGEDTKTETWITGLTVEHFNKKGTPLTGSEFKLTGDNINTTIKYTSKFTADAAGTYYKLVNGSYTNVEPVDETRDQYDLAAGMFVRSDELVTINETPTEVSAAIDENGILTITGLKAGTYKLQNTKIPNGYNLAEDIDFVISFDEAELFSSNNQLVQERTPEWFYVTIIAGNGTLLPETGGIGVYMLYGVGMALVAMAGIVFVVKGKRKAD